MKKKKLFLKAALSMGLFLGFASSSASASHLEITPQSEKISKFSGVNSKYVNNNKEELINKMEELGVKKGKIKGLLKKIANGKTLDSNNPEKVKAAKEELALTLEHPKKEYEFEDGSVLKVSITPPSNENNLLKSDGPERSYSCGSGYCVYVDHKITASTATLDAEAKVTFGLNYGAADNISSMKELVVGVTGGTHSDKRIDIPRPTEDIYNDIPAIANGAFTVKYFGESYGTVEKLRLSVGSDTYNVFLY
ncbi:hypothetical protein [Rossellomorea sp. LJF3]|uniref:hypothetical protein n=1 Tax=Rossellomorea sp. LJF3 TaxID=3126099 RepID=UPI00300C9B30